MSITTKSNEIIAQEEKLKGIPFAEVADLRDHFAAKAMQGDMACDSLSPDITDEQLVRYTDHYYRIADAMIAARSR